MIRIIPLSPFARTVRIRRAIPSRSAIAPLRPRKSRNHRASVEALEPRQLLSGYQTITFDSTDPVNIPVAKTKADQTIPLVVNFTTTDTDTPEDTENEWVEIEGSDGYQVTVYGYGTQTIDFPITQNGETISAWVDGADGDESASITAGDRIIQVSTDLANFAAPWLSLANDLEQSEEAFERILQFAPGWQFYPPSISVPPPSGKISGQVSIAPDGSIDGGSAGLSGSVEANLTTELYWGLPAKLAGLSGSLTAGLAVGVGVTASWDNAGNLTVTGALTPEGSLSVAGNAYFTFFKGTVSGKGTLEIPISLNSDGEASAEVNLTGQVAGQLQYKGLTDKDYVTMASLSTTFGPIQVGQWSVNLGEIVEQAVEQAEGDSTDDVGDPLVATTSPPVSVVAGTPFGMVVTAENSDGSVNTSFNGSVTVYNEYSYPTVMGTTTVVAVNGVATFNKLILDQAGTVYALGVDSGNLSATTGEIDVTPAAASALVFEETPSPVADEPFPVMVHAEDAYGNPTSDFDGTVTISVSGGPSGASLGGTPTATASNGVATFSGLTIDEIGTNYTLQATASGLTNGTSSPFDVDDQLVVTSVPPSSVVAGSPFSISVSAENGAGVVDASYDGSVTIDDETFTLGSSTGSLTVQAVNGVATFSGLTITQATSSDELTVTGSKAAQGASSSFTVEAGAATQLAIPQVRQVIAGVPFDVTVQAEDSYGNTVSDFDGTVTLSLSGGPSGASLGGTLTAPASNGVATFSGLTIDQTGDGYSVEAIASGLSPGTSPTFTVDDQLDTTSGPRSSVGAGSPFTVVVTAENGAGQVDTSYDGSVTIYDDTETLGGALAVQAVNGVATFSGLTITQATSSDELTVTGSDAAQTTSTSFAVNPGAPSRLAFQGQVGTMPSAWATGNAVVTPNSPFDATVHVEDQYGNAATSFNGTVTLALAYSPWAATLSGPLTATTSNGVATFSGLTMEGTGTNFALTASTGGLTPALSNPFDVSDFLVISNPAPNSVSAGARFGLVVEAQDASGNVDKSFNGNVTIVASNYSGGSVNLLGGTATVQAVDGVATFSNLTIDQAGNFSLDITASGAAYATQVLQVNSNPATVLALATPMLPLTAGAPLSLMINAEDAYGNVDPNFNGTVTLTLATNPGGSILGGTLTATAVDGVATFSGLTINNPGTGYTLEAMASGLTPATTQAFNVTPLGVATQMVITTAPPGSVTAGDSFGLVVTAQDSSGTSDTSFNGPVTLDLGQNTGGGTLGGTLTVDAVGGVATFTGLSLDAAGTYTIVASGFGLAPATTSPFDVEAASATQFGVSVPTIGTLTGSQFSITVQAEDHYGNVDQTYGGNVTLALGTNPASAALGGTLTVAAVNGVATFTGLSINVPGNGYTLQAGDGTLPEGVSEPFLVATDALAVLDPPPASVAAGSPFGVVVQVNAASGSVDTTYNGPVTLGLVQYGYPQTTLGGTLTVNAVSGVATFSGLTIDQIGSYSLSVTAIGMSLLTTDIFHVTAAQLSITGEPPMVVTATAPFSVTVTAGDAAVDADPNFEGPVTLALANNSGGATLGGTLTVEAVDGVATFTGLTISKPGTGYTLRAAATGLSGATTGSFDAAATGVATQLVVTSALPSSVAAGSPFRLAVTAEDGFGNVIQSYDGAVTLADETGALAGTLTVQAVDGMATFSGLTIDQAWPDDTLVATAAGLAGITTGTIEVTPGAASQLQIALPGAPIMTGGSFAIQVVAEDPYRNIDPDFDGVITLTLGGIPAAVTLGGTLSATASQGVATFSGLSISGAAAALTLTASGPGGVSGTTSPFNVTDDDLVFTTPPPGSITAGTPFSLAVAAEHAAGNVDTGFNGTITLSDPAFGQTLGGTTTVTAVNGVATFPGLTLTEAGAGQTLTATTGDLALATSPALDIVSAAPTQLVITAAPPGNVTAAAPFEVNVTVEDAAGNVATGYSGNVTIALSTNPGGAYLGGTLVVAAVNGVAAFANLTLNQAGSGYALTASATGLGAVTTVDFEVAPAGVATQLVLTSQPPDSIAAGSPFGLVAKAEDGFGTVDATFAGTVTVTVEGTGGMTPSATATATAVDGVATFSDLSLTQAGSDIVLSITGGSLNPATTAPMVVDALPASQLAVSGPVGTLQPGSHFSIVVLAQDQYGNIDPNFHGEVTLDLSDNPAGATLGGTTAAPANGGYALLSGLSINQVGSGYTLHATTPGLTSGTCVPFEVASDELVITTQPPASVAAGSSFSFTVAAEGSSGSVDTSFGGNVTVSAVNSEGQSVTLGGRVTVSLVNGMATFTDLTLPQPDTYILSVTGANTGGASTVMVAGPSPALPTVAGISPSVGTIGGGTQVTITGANFDTASTATVDFGAANPGTIVSDTGTTIVATDPAGTNRATVDVTVTTSAGTSATSPADQFTYESSPSVTHISPAMGPTAGGTVVTISGTNLAGATAVMFGSAAGTISSDSQTQIVAVSPKGAAGTVAVTIVTPLGTSAGSSADQFTYQAPRITPPVLAAIPAQHVDVGHTLDLNVSNYATDPNTPPLPLTYRLATGAPSGMRINPSTGVLTWVVGANQHIGAYPVTVLVSDNGTPHRTVSGTFDVGVVDPGPAPTVPSAMVQTKKGFITITIKFSEPVNPATAANPNNYVLTEPAAKPKPTKQRTPPPTTVGLAVSYNQSADTVTLTALQKVKTTPPLTLTVVGTSPNGIAKPDGLLLAGTGGESGTNYVALVTNTSVSPITAVANSSIVGMTPVRLGEGRTRAIGRSRPTFVRGIADFADSVHVAVSRPGGPMALMRKPALRKVGLSP